jgi:glycosyltransferase involved in cell wall biosynthesis
MAVRKWQFACSVVIPTFRRANELTRALESADAQNIDDAFEVIVVDNNADGAARAQVRAFAARARRPVRYVHETRPGVSAARNRGLTLAQGELVAFLDDDEEADADWLARLVAAQRASNADAVFGWVEPVCDLPGPSPEDGLRSEGDAAAPIFLAPFARRFDEATGPVPPRLVARLGTGNSLFHRRVLGGERTFDPRFGLSGGEDSALIKRIAAEGRTLIWCREARVREYVLPERVTLAFLLERRFSCGQLRTGHYLSGPERSLRQAAKWMFVGFVQAATGALLAGPSALVAPAFARRMLAEAAGGLGKVLWMEPFLVQRYRRGEEEASNGDDGNDPDPAAV